MKLFIRLIVVLVLVSNCQSKNKESKIENDSTIHKGIAQEIIDTEDFIYIRIIENDLEKWVATSPTNVEIGKTYYFKTRMAMSYFESKKLNRTFENIYFVDKLSDNPDFDNVSMTTPSSDLNPHEKISTPKIQEDTINIEPIKDGITIAELYKNRKKYANKKVKVRGQVVKVNYDIMNRNWVHLKDGTSNEGKSDLTVTTLREVKVGDIVTLEGIVALDKEYGAGYIYPLVVEGVTSEEAEEIKTNI